MAAALSRAPRLPVVWLSLQECTGCTESLTRSAVYDKQCASCQGSTPASLKTPADEVPPSCVRARCVLIESI